MAISARVYGPGAALLLLLSHWLLFSGWELAGRWFYLMAWWPYIFLVDWLVRLKKGDSLVTGRPREFLLLIPCSASLWLIFEGFNLRLGNWHYVDLVPDLARRWPGYFSAFGTVLPGLFITYQLLEACGLLKGCRIRPLKEPRLLYPLLVLLGGLGLVLPLAQPRYFFPLVWLAFTFLLEPVNYALGAPSLLGDWQRGDPRRLYLLLLAGLICGFLWEFWNFWAVSKWVYTVPLVGGLKVFEMPLLGFLGFPPFAVECYVMVNFLSLFRGGRSWEHPGGGSAIALRLPPWLGLILCGAFCLLMFHLIDTHTVLNFLP